MNIKREQGFAMIFTLILLATVPILAMGLANYSLNAFKIAIGNDKETRAYYLARSGAEAAIAAWKNYPLDNKPGSGGEENIATVIFDSNNNFVLKNNFDSNSSDYGEKVAEIDVEVSENDDGSTSFVSTADLGDYSETVTATVSIYTTGHDINPPWYDEDNGVINPGSNTEETTISEDFWQWLADLFGWGYEPETVDIKYHDEVYGTVEIETDDVPLTLMDDDNNNKVAYIANTMFFRNNLDLRQDWGNHGVLITIADTLVFNNRIDIRERNFFLWSSYSSLILGLPEGQGEKLDNYEGVFGKVYFVDGVYRNGNEIISPNSAYYFKKIIDDQGEQSGLDLIRWDDGDYVNNVMIPIPADDKYSSPPDPEEEYVIIWN